MPYNPDIHHRRSIRLAGYDYASAGGYFITICIAQREHLFGRVQHGVMQLNAFGQIVEDCWYDLPNHYAHVVLDTFIVMPDHVHGIIVLVNEDNGDKPVVGAGLRPAPTSPAPTSPVPGADRPTRAGLAGVGLRPAPTPTPHKRHGLPEIVRAFKSFSARRINHLCDMTGTSLWQRNYYEHIIRNEEELRALREYVANNPVRWAETRC